MTFLPLGGELAPVYLLVIELKSMDKLDDALDWVKKNCKTAYRGFDDGGKVELEEEENLQKADFIASLEPLGRRTLEVADLVQFGNEVNFDSSELYETTLHKLKVHGVLVGSVALDLPAMLARKDKVVKELPDGWEGRSY